jgi:hypothetical protein
MVWTMAPAQTWAADEKQTETVSTGTTDQSESKGTDVDGQTAANTGSVDQNTGKPITGCAISLAYGSATYTGKELTPEVTVKTQDGATALTKGTDYTVSYKDNTNAGTATVTVTGKGDYTGTGLTTFTIDPRSLAGATVTLKTSSYHYDGKDKTPEVTVALDGNALGDTDYTVSYANNKNIGTATVTVTGKGNYTGTATQSFTIKKDGASIANAEITLSQTTYTYDGSSKTPTVKSATLGGEPLTPGTDYTVSYKDNIEVGTGKVILTAAGTLVGTVTETFTIKKQQTSLASAVVTLSETSYVYDGAIKTPAVKSVMLGNKTLTAGKDYTISYQNNTNIGTAKVTVTGIGDYTGTATKTFTITGTGTSLANAVVTLATTSYTYDGSAKEPAVTSVVLGSVTLKAGTDYTIYYKDNVNVGTATVTITGTGSYTGTVTRTFTIKSSGTSLSSASVTLAKTS